GLSVNGAAVTSDDVLTVYFFPSYYLGHKYNTKIRQIKLTWLMKEFKTLSDTSDVDIIYYVRPYLLYLIALVILSDTITVFVLHLQFLE
ncbi:hypothetical protein OFM39_30420, partial [Escherichia coli]|nr:hypothetical protein [Escherichia coli]